MKNTAVPEFIITSPLPHPITPHKTTN